jgi:hypothetical protein
MATAMPVEPFSPVGPQAVFMTAAIPWKGSAASSSQSRRVFRKRFIYSLYYSARHSFHRTGSHSKLSHEGKVKRFFD